MPETDARLALPGPLPEGEYILWQGAPVPSSFARRALHARVVALYFGAVAIFTAGMAWAEGRTLGSAAMTLAIIAAATLAVLGFIWILSRLVGRTTRYTITNRRVVMRIGVALPFSLNVPFTIVEGAGLKVHADGTGDIPLQLGGTGRIGYLHLWPHARPWRLARPEPMLRSVPDAAQVAAILARALGANPLARAAAARQDAAAAPAEAAAATAAA